MYHDRQMSLDDVATELQCAYSTAHRLLTAYGIEKRTREQGRFVLRNKTHNIDIKFFETESPDFYYFLGLMITDGWVSDQGSISLSMTDRDVIDYVISKIGYTNSVFEKTSKRYPNAKPMYTISFRNQTAFEILKKYGICPRKTLTAKFPRVPNAYLSDFVRGVFDGDGSIYVRQRREGNSLQHEFSIVSASSEFIYDLGRAMSEQANLQSVKYRTVKKGRGNPLYGVRVTRRSDLQKLSEWMYRRDVFGMQRKKEKNAVLTSKLSKERRRDGICRDFL